MPTIDPRHGVSTLVTHICEKQNALNAHVTPIYQTSTFVFPDVETGAALLKVEKTVISIRA